MSLRTLNFKVRYSQNLKFRSGILRNGLERAQGLRCEVTGSLYSVFYE